MKKTLLAGMTAAALMLVISSGFADDQQNALTATAQAPLPADSALLQQISSQLSALPNQLTAAMAQQGMGSFTSLEQFLYQFMWLQTIQPWIVQNDHTPNPNLSQMTALNNITIPASAIPGLNNSKSQPPLTPSQAVMTIAQEKTGANVKNSLLQFSYSLNQQDPSNGIKAADGKSYALYLQNEAVTGPDGLILGDHALADDTLYISDPNSMSASSTANQEFYFQNKKLLERPQTLDNGQFDFSNVINPVSYTPEQQEQAERFIKYAALSTQNLLSGVNFSKLYNNPQAILKIKQNPVYQNYMMKIRNIIALRSISLYAFNALIAERTPIQNLGAQINQQGPASPLQVEDYRATHDLKNPTWYQQLTNEEPATVQRDILITLKEMEAQNYQMQLQNERLMSIILAMSLSNASTQNLALTVEQQKLNNAISSALGEAKPETPQEKMKNAAGGKEATQYLNQKNLNNQNIQNEIGKVPTTNNTTTTTTTTP